GASRGLLSGRGAPRGYLPLDGAPAPVCHPSPRMSDPLLSVHDLRTYFHTPAGVARAVDGVSFEVRRGETVGLVGESGCGKSVTGFSILRLIPPPGRTQPGSRIVYEGEDLLAASERRLREIRGDRISMI